METNALIEQLQKRLLEYKISNLYSNKVLKQDIISIQIALCLLEMALYCGRFITEEEKYWFKGEFYIANDITGEWEDIAIMYSQIVSIANQYFA